MNPGSRAHICLLSILIAMSGSGAGSIRVSAAAAPASSPVDSKARDALIRMAEYLRTVPAFTVHAETTRDEVVSRNFKLQRSTKTDVTVKRPDRLRADVEGDDGARTFIYDGQLFTVFSRLDNYYATTEAPAIILDALEMLLQRYGVELPLLDVVYAAVGGNLGESILEAGDIGPSRVAGVDCEHLAFRGSKVDWQVWVERGERPLPRKIVVTTRVEAAPQFIAALSWEVAPATDDAAFVFTPPQGAMRIPFRPLQEPAAERRRAQETIK
jgi:hypothetical protein